MDKFLEVEIAIGGDRGEEATRLAYDGSCF